MTVLQRQSSGLFSPRDKRLKFSCRNFRSASCSDRKLVQQFYLGMAQDCNW